MILLKVNFESLSGVLLDVNLKHMHVFVSLNW